MKKLLSLMNPHSRRDFIKTGTIAGSMAFMPWMFHGKDAFGSDSLLREQSENASAEDLLQLGLLDVTGSPFFADKSGSKDSTTAIQDAVNYARDNGLVCFFPEGTYTISDMISCEQRVEKLDVPRAVVGMTQHYWDVQRPMVLMGSNKGKRPLIKLSKDAKGFDDPKNPKKAIWIWAQTRNDERGKDEPVWGKEQGNISFRHFFMNIDIDVRGHAGAIGLRHNGSQGSAIFNTKIFAEGAYSGLTNCCGQGGGTYNVEVVGGNFGIIIDSDCRFPILTSCVFSGQLKSAVSYTGPSIQVPTVFVGCSFKSSGDSCVDMSTCNSYGGLQMIDCVCETGKAGKIIKTNKPENVFIENSFSKGAEFITSEQKVIGSTADWIQISRFNSKNEQSVSMVNGEPVVANVVNTERYPGVPDYSAMHKRHYSGIPFFDDPDVVNVKDFGAKGDGETDDTEAFRKAMDSGKKVFFPKGSFKLTGSVNLGPETVIFGLTQSFTSIGGANQRRSSGNITDSNEPAMNFGLVTMDDINASPGLFLLGIRGGIKWSSGKGIWVMTSGTPEFSGNGGGRFYGYGSVGRHFLMEGIRQPTSFYSLNVERVRSNPQSEIRNCSDIKIYYFKVEAGSLAAGNPNDLSDINTPGKISNSENISIYCMYGSVSNMKDRPMLEIVDSKNILVSQLKSFHPEGFPHLKEMHEGEVLIIPSDKAVAFFMRD